MVSIDFAASDMVGRCSFCCLVMAAAKLSRAAVSWLLHSERWESYLSWGGKINTQDRGELPQHTNDDSDEFEVHDDINSIETKGCQNANLENYIIVQGQQG